MPIRVLIADDQTLVRAGLAALLGMEDDIDIVAEVANGEQAVNYLSAHDVDVAMLDIEMPVMDGIAAAEKITTSTECNVLMVTTFGRAGYLRRALDAGAKGFMVKDAPAEQLLDAIRAVHSGGSAIDPELAAQALAQGNNPLTDRERELLRLTLTGASIKQLAATLFISQGTVRNHLSSAIAKTHTDNRTAAAHTAQDRGWL
ncbi:response regulator transcription factor [Corynebacterium sp. TAE3-ERU12]|uniref:response regulator transcription factor n=1 Tax=Corynebacterium sp. TAE3-ERU12 TaxID=2849491 RepID=UPI001C44663F|nr:response regulator transcription factor [Corynebacterium sp. TAE3-ERU12]MBV7295557.1 response regulator transcription factor [Corynebacterium sp. TAE3-ERU12]